MSKRILTPVLFLLMVAFASPVLAASPAEERAEIDKAAAKVLNDLYKEQPSAKKVFFAGGGSGKGYAIRGGKKTYMKMLEVQAGLGLGVKKFGLVWVFNSKSAYDQFVNSGWEVGGQASAAAKHEDQGDAFQGAIAIADGVFLYQITESGLAAELTVKGTKYYKDDDLN